MLTGEFCRRGAALTAESAVKTPSSERGNLVEKKRKFVRRREDRYDRTSVIEACVANNFRGERGRGWVGGWVEGCRGTARPRSIRSRSRAPAETRRETRRLCYFRLENSFKAFNTRFWTRDTYILLHRRNRKGYIYGNATPLARDGGGVSAARGGEGGQELGGRGGQKWHECV